MREKGFTLIELMIVVAIIAIIAAIAIPNLLRARLAANESSAIASLRTISSAQETFRSSIVKDQDADGLGEYGTLSELAGLTAGAGMSAPASPPFIDNQLGQGTKSGYNFVVLVGTQAGCTPVGATAMSAPNASEIEYFAVAVPVAHQRTGNRSFILDASGVIRGSDVGSVTVSNAAVCNQDAIGTNPWPVIG